MSETDVMQKVVTILKPYAKNGEALAQVGPSTHILDELKVNSARLVDVVLAFEDEFGIEIADDDVESLVREQAEIVGDDAEATIERLRENGRFETLRDDLRLREALDHVASEVKRIPRELAEARDALWTPDKEKQATDTKLWTPGS